MADGAVSNRLRISTSVGVEGEGEEKVGKILPEDHGILCVCVCEYVCVCVCVCVCTLGGERWILSLPSDQLTEKKMCERKKPKYHKSNHDHTERERKKERKKERERYLSGRDPPYDLTALRGRVTGIAKASLPSSLLKRDVAVDAAVEEEEEEGVCADRTLTISRKREDSFCLGAREEEEGKEPWEAEESRGVSRPAEKLVESGEREREREGMMGHQLSSLFFIFSFSLNKLVRLISLPLSPSFPLLLPPSHSLPLSLPCASSIDMDLPSDESDKRDGDASASEERDGDADCVKRGTSIRLNLREERRVSEVKWQYEERQEGREREREKVRARV